MNNKFLIVNGDSTTTEQFGALQNKLFDNIDFTKNTPVMAGL